MQKQERFILFWSCSTLGGFPALRGCPQPTRSYLAERIHATVASTEQELGENKYRTGNAWEGKGNSMKIAWTGSLRLKESTFMSSLLLQNAAFVACFQRVWFYKHDTFALSRTSGQHQGYSRKNCVLDPHIMQLNTIRYSNGIRRVIKASFINFLLCYSLLCVLWGKRQVAKRLASNTMSFESSLRIAKELLRYRILEYLSCFGHWHTFWIFTPGPSWYSSLVTPRCSHI